MTSAIGRLRAAHQALPLSTKGCSGPSSVIANHGRPVKHSMVAILHAPAISAAGDALIGQQTAIECPMPSPVTTGMATIYRLPS